MPDTQSKDTELQIEVQAPAAARWLNDTISAMVDEEMEVEIETVVLKTHTVFRVRVAPGDVGKVIGKQGHTAKALRSLLNGRAKKDGAVYVLDIVQTDRVAAAEEEVRNG